MQTSGHSRLSGVLSRVPLFVTPWTEAHLTPCDPMDCSLPGSSVHGIFQARILECGAMPSSRGSSQSRDGTWVHYVSCTVGELFSAEPLGLPQTSYQTVWVGVPVQSSIQTHCTSPTPWNDLNRALGPRALQPDSRNQLCLPVVLH